MFIGLLSFSGYLVTKRVSLNKEQWKTRPALINLNPVELNYYPFMISLDECNGSCNFLTKISGRICIPNKTWNVNLSVFNLITKKKKKVSKPLTNHISCKSNCKCYSRKCNSNQKKVIFCWENSWQFSELMWLDYRNNKKYSDESVPAKSIPTNFNEEKMICEIENVLYLLAFFLITMTWFWCS